MLHTIETYLAMGQPAVADLVPDDPGLAEAACDVLRPWRAVRRSDGFTVAAESTERAARDELDRWLLGERDYAVSQWYRDGQDGPEPTGPEPSEYEVFCVDAPASIELPDVAPQAEEPAVVYRPGRAKGSELS